MFCGLPHGTTQEIIAAVLAANPAIKILDMSADFRLRDMATYAQWYGHEHRAPQLQDEAVYGLTEFYREKIAAARLVACPGCYPTAALLALVPIAKARLIDVDDIVIDAKSGVTGAGRGLKQNTLFSEAGEGLSPYSVGTHRHAPEIEQEIGVAAGAHGDGQFHAASDPDEPRRTLHVLCQAQRRQRRTICAPRWQQAYRDEPFVHVVKKGVLPQTQNVRGSNYVQIGVFADRIKNRAIVDFRARQSGEGLGRAGDPEHEPDVRVSRDHGARADRVVSVIGLGFRGRRYGANAGARIRRLPNRWIA